MEMKYVSFDPGDSTGWATFNEDGGINDYGTISGRDPLYHFLHKLPNSITHVICEDYEIYPWKAKQQSWLPVTTARYIGAIEHWTVTNSRIFVLQKPNIKVIGYKWAGIKVPKNKDLTHETDAYVHGVYYLQKEGIRQPQQARIK